MFVSRFSDARGCERRVVESRAKIAGLPLYARNRAMSRFSARLRASASASASVPAVVLSMVPPTSAASYVSSRSSSSESNVASAERIAALLVACWLRSASTASAVRSWSARPKRSFPSALPERLSSAMSTSSSNTFLRTGMAADGGDGMAGGVGRGAKWLS